VLPNREIATFPVRTNQIPRAIPQQQWYLHPVISCMLGGILPFGAVSVELYFIMSALWLHQVSTILAGCECTVQSLWHLIPSALYLRLPSYLLV
jgi:hypothetical protein